MAYQILISEHVFKEAWKGLNWIEEKMIITNSLFNSLEKIQQIFENSHIFENSLIELSTKKESSCPGSEKTICGIFKLVFYPDFEYLYRIWFFSQNEIIMQIGYTQKDYNDPRSKFVGQVLLDNFKRLLNPI